MDLSLKPDILTAVSREEFDRLYFTQQKPCVIKGVFDHQPAATKWTMEWFKQNHGDIVVDLYDSKLTNAAKTAITRPHHKMRFADYLDLISGSEPTDYRMFLFDIFKAVPELRNDLTCPPIFQSILKDVGFAFFGGINSVTRMHQDIDMSNVLLTQFDGKKRVVLFAPDQSPYLYKLPFNTFGLVDIERPDYETYPALRKAKGYDIILERGDAVFIPSGYWHHIVYLTGGFGVSYRRPGSTGKVLTGLFNLGLEMPVDKILSRVFKDSWYQIKKQVAFMRANKALNKSY